MASESIVKIEKSTRKGKKYMATVRDDDTNKTRIVHFGALSFQQYFDSTRLKLYSDYNHKDVQRRHNYFQRFSGTKSKKKALAKVLSMTNGKISPMYLSHKYLW